MEKNKEKNQPLKNLVRNYCVMNHSFSRESKNIIIQ